MGPQGSPGAAGPAGPQGETGAQGVPGPAGPVGPEGPQGPTGPQGAAGTGINVKGTVPDAASLPSSGNTAGDAWVTANDSHLHVWSAPSGPWADLGPIQGPAGPTGPEGPMGPAGAQGPQGIPGPVGPQGAQGVPGPAGPMGPQGPQGPQGPPGNPYGSPLLAVGAVVHWRPERSTHDRYGFCKPAIVLWVPDEYNNILALNVLGTQGSPQPFLQDRVPTGYDAGEWHFISNCPYSMSTPSSLNAPVTFNGFIRVTSGVP